MQFNPNSGDDVNRHCRHGSNYERSFVERERVKGIEPSYAAWEAAVLPLNYTRGTIADCGVRRVDWQAVSVIARR